MRIVVVLLSAILALSSLSLCLGHLEWEMNSNHRVVVSDTPFDPSNVTYYSWHIHVYFMQNNKNDTATATALRNQFIQEFSVVECDGGCDVLCPKICHWDLNLQPIGPHTFGSWGIYVPIEYFASTAAWISIHHGSLNVLIHPNSGYPTIDHMVNSLWIGQKIPLDASGLGDQLPTPSPVIVL